MSTFQVPTVDYLSRDFTALMDDFINLIPFFTQEWTDRSPDDFGIVLAELFSYGLDGAHFYIDRRAQNAYLPSAFTRPAVIRLSKIIDYDVPGKLAATADELFLMSEPVDGELTIPKDTTVQTAGGTSIEPVSFQTLVDSVYGYQLLTADVAAADTVSVLSTLKFAAGDYVNVRDDVTPDGEQVQIEEVVNLTTLRFTAPLTGAYTVAQNAKISVIGREIPVQEGESDEELGWDDSDGLAWQTRKIEQDDVIRNSIHVYVEEGSTFIEWEIVDSLADALPTDNVCEVSLEDDSRYIVRFGDGSTGRIPPINAGIKAEYRFGGGIDGNVGANTIINMVSTITFGGSVVSFTVTNPESASGGADEIALEEAKLLGPLSLRALNRAVTLEDYSTLAFRVDGVGEAIAINVMPTYLRQINVYITPTGGYYPTQTLIDLVYEYLDARNMAGDVLSVLGPVHTPEIDVSGTVYVFDEYEQLAVASDVEDALDEFFSPGSEEARFGRDVHFSDLIALIDNIEGVDYWDCDKMTLDPNTVVTLAPWSGDAVIDTLQLSTLGGAPDPVVEDWTIEFTGITSFRLIGSVSGTFLGGSVGVLFQPGGCSVEVLITNTGNPQAIGDKATFRTSVLRGNVLIEDFEIRKRGDIALTFSGGSL